MLDRLVEIFCAMDDFCKAFFAQCVALQLSAGKAWERGPECGLLVSDIMTIVVLYHYDNLGPSQFTDALRSGLK